MANGAEHGIRPTGGGVYGTSGRIEKGYRLQGAELESEYNPLEAGLARPKVKSADFIGKEAYLAAREAGEPEVHMCTLTVEDQHRLAGPRALDAGRQRADLRPRRQRRSSTRTAGSRGSPRPATARRSASTS